MKINSASRVPAVVPPRPVGKEPDKDPVAEAKAAKAAQKYGKTVQAAIKARRDGDKGGNLDTKV